VLEGQLIDGEAQRNDIRNSAYLIVVPEGVQMVLLAHLSLCWDRWMDGGSFASRVSKDRGRRMKIGI
jgi:hypothetical protein